MDAKERELMFKDEVHAISGWAIGMLNGIGHGRHEEPCENALAAASDRRGTPFAPQQRFPVPRRGTRAGEFVPDRMACARIIVDPKTIGKMLDDLKPGGLELGLPVNLKPCRLGRERIAPTRRPEKPAQTRSRFPSNLSRLS